MIVSNIPYFLQKCIIFQFNLTCRFLTYSNIKEILEEISLRFATSRSSVSFASIRTHYVTYDLNCDMRTLRSTIGISLLLRIVSTQN